MTPSPDQSELPFGPTVHPLVTAGAKTPIVPPTGSELADRAGHHPRRARRPRARLPGGGRGQRDRAGRGPAGGARPTPSTAASTTYVYASQPNPDPTFNAHQPGDMRHRPLRPQGAHRHARRVRRRRAPGRHGDHQPAAPDRVPQPRRAHRRRQARRRRHRRRRQPARRLRPHDRHPLARHARSGRPRRCSSRAQCGALPRRRRCTRAPTIRSPRSPTSTRRSTPTCCCTTWATASRTA